MNIKQTNNYQEDLSSGNIENKDYISITGFVNSLTTEATVWSKGGVISFPAAAKLSIASSSAQDKSGGSGATTMVINGVDGFDIITEEEIDSYIILLL